ncbi:AEC family transporter [Sporolactobacillus pectinivorans]|uniref:AEC family transporter n=1 Tax=Sporolactobacillus pectinivorans TaxID=1591408 RepID=UPI000C262495|nr:AEC family transporter [Sporolactobacillus pectinivorans]
MEFAVILHQVIVIFMLMVVGFFAHKWQFIHKTGAKDMTKILLYIVSPCVILKAFQRPFSADRLNGLVISLICILVVYGFSILAARFIFNNSFIKDSARRNALKFSTTYSNAGFMGIPLVSSILGSSGVFFATPYLAGFNLLCWTHGISLYRTHQSKKRIIENMFNPNILAIFIGFGLFLFSIRLPALLATGVTYLSNLNTPLSMIVIGDSMASVSPLGLFADKLIWPGIVMRNLIVPTGTLVLLHFTGIGQTVLLTTVLLSSCPVAGIVILFALLNDSDTAFPTRLMTVSTLLSIITIPLVAALAVL